MEYRKEIMQKILAGLFLILFSYLNLASQTINPFAYAQADSFIIIRMDKDLDSFSAYTEANYSVDNGISIKRIFNDANDSRTIILLTDNSLEETDYTVLISGLKYKDKPDQPIADFELEAPYDPHPWYNMIVDSVPGISHHSYWSESNNRLVGYSVYTPVNYSALF
jgi:hypothetical protein